MSEIVLSNDIWQVGLLPETAGSISFGRIRLQDSFIEVMRPTAPGAPYGDTASYPLVPWSNRIRDGKLTWRGQDYQLRINFADGTAIHGAALEFPWEVSAQEPTRVSLTFDSRKYVGVNWPWQFVAQFDYELHGAKFVCRMHLTNVDTEAFPGGFGHHPHFLRQLSLPNQTTFGKPVELQLNCAQGYETSGIMAIGPAGEIAPHADFRELRNLGTPFVDDCYTGRTSAELARIFYPDALDLRLEASDNLTHAVVYIPEGQNFFAVEPVSNANDGFNLHEQGVPGMGVLIVEPGQTHAAEFAFIANQLA